MDDGFLNVVKPPALTSHDLVQQVRSLAAAKVGHTGTLDPAAAGVMVLTVGAATKLSQYVLDLHKSYRAEVTLGITTDSHDAEGTVTHSAPASGLTVQAIQEALAELTGEIAMVPPAYSAAHIGGKRAYELAREGKAVALQPRPVAVYQLRLVEFRDGDFPQVMVDIDCSKGTYVRSLAAMLGQRLRCGAYLSALVRTAVGQHRLDDAVTLPQLADDGLAAYLISAVEGLTHLPAVTLGQQQVAAARHGNRISGLACDVAEAHSPGAFVRLLVASGELIAVAEAVRDDRGAHLQPRTVLPDRGE